MLSADQARRKARYGHKDFIRISEADGYAPLSVSNIKRALLAAGTSGKIYVIAANNALTHRWSWRMGVQNIRNAKHIGIPQ